VAVRIAKVHGRCRHPPEDHGTLGRLAVKIERDDTGASQPVGSGEDILLVDAECRM